MVKRRDFFKKFLFNMNIFKDEIKGVKHFKLTDLWGLEEQQFKSLTFKLKDNIVINESSNEIMAVCPSGKNIIICKKNTIEEDVFKLFQEELCVEEILEYISFEKKKGFDTDFLYVRDYLLSLVKQNICIPSNDLDYDEKTNINEK